MSDLHPITIIKNGVETRLDQYAYGIQTKNGVHTVPALAGESPLVQGRSGSLYYPGKRRQPGVSYLSMYVQEDDLEEGNYEAWLRNYDMLVRLFDTSMKQIIVREYTDSVPYGVTNLSGYNYREALCEVGMAMNPELQGRYWSKMVVECVLNEGSWREKTIHDITVPITTFTPQELTDLDGTTAHIEDCILCFDGPAVSPRVTDVYTGHYVSLSGSIPSGSQWVVDCGTWKSVMGVGINFGTASAESMTSRTTSSGLFTPRLFAISADSPPRVQVSGSGFTSSSRLRIRARRRFL